MFRFTQSLTSMHLFPCGPLEAIPARWLRYTPAKSDTKSEIKIREAKRDYVAEIFSGTCGNLTSLGCFGGAGNDKLDFNGVGGQTYFIAVGRISSTTTTNPVLHLSD